MGYPQLRRQMLHRYRGRRGHGAALGAVSKGRRLGRRMRLYLNLSVRRAGWLVIPLPFSVFPPSNRWYRGHGHRTGVEATLGAVPHRAVPRGRRLGRRGFLSLDLYVRSNGWTHRRHEPRLLDLGHDDLRWSEVSAKNDGCLDMRWTALGAVPEDRRCGAGASLSLDLNARTTAWANRCGTALHRFPIWT